MITGLHHTGIVVRNLEKMVHFYRDVLGLTQNMELDSVAPPDGDHTGVPGARRKLVFLGHDTGHQIELVHYLEPHPREGSIDKHQFGAMHICFSVDDLEQMHASLQQRGVHFATEPKFTESPEKGRVGIVYFQDPEKNWLELIEWS